MTNNEKSNNTLGESLDGAVSNDKNLDDKNSNEIKTKESPTVLCKHQNRQADYGFFKCV
jgi:hypothetical protein